MPAVTIALRASATLLMIAYLGGGAIPAFSAILFVLGILFPSAALLAHFGPGRTLPGGLRMILGMVLALVAIPPLFYLRRFLPVPPALLDALTILALCLATIRTQAASRFFQDLLAPGVRASAGVLFFWLPLTFSLVWMGFAIRQGSKILFTGLFPVDFCWLAEVVVMIKASPAFPLNPIVGTGTLTYHWHYFTMPAWLTEFLGFNLPVGPALMLSNYVVACVLFLALWETAIRFCSGPRAGRHAALTASVIVFAPLISQFILRLLPAGLFTEPRNLLLLSVINSMVTFGNNTLALAMVLVGLLLIDQWQRSGRWIHLVPCALFLAILHNFSVTLLIPLIAACGGAIALVAFKRSQWFFWIAVGIGLACALALEQRLPVGQDLRKVTFGFDSGRFACTVLLGILPLWALAALAIQRRRDLQNYWLLLAACIAIPSLYYIDNSPTGAVDLSMKTGSLVMVLLTPMTALGLHKMAGDWPLRRWRVLGCTLLLGAALVQTAAYLLQFPLSRLGASWRRNALELPLEYCQAMEFVRVASPKNSLVIDSEAPSRTTLLNPAPVLSERRAFLAQPSELESLASRYPEVARRSELWREWESGGYTNRALSTLFAGQADFLVLKGHPALEPDWEDRFRVGEYTVYASRTGPGTNLQR